MVLRLAGLIVFLGLFAGGDRIWGQGKKSEVETIEAPTPAYERYLKVVAETRRLREAGDMEGLDALARELRESGEKMDNGLWLLGEFYKEATVLPEEDKEISEAVEFYRGWVRKYPKSVTARICLAKVMGLHAWNVYSAEDQEEKVQERLFEERQKEAWKALAEAEQLQERCPELQAAILAQAFDDAWDKDAFMDGAAQARKKAPDYPGLDLWICNYLDYEWYGDEGELARWMAGEAGRAPEGRKDRRYAQLVWLADVTDSGSGVYFEENGPEWARTKKGFEEWLKEEPGNDAVRFKFLDFALRAADRQVVKEQFAATGNRYWPEMWEEDRERFDQSRRYAAGELAEPPSAWEDEQSPFAEIPQEILDGTAAVLGLLARLTGGLLGGLFCLWLAVRHKQVMIGVVVLLASMVLAAIFGTLAAIIPACILGLCLLFLPVPKEETPPPPPLTPGRGLLLLIALSVFNCLLQFGAVFMEMVIWMVKNRGDETGVELVLDQMNSSGSLYVVLLNAAWISLLFLLACCRARDVAGYRKILGLRGFPPLLAGLLVLGGAIFLPLLFSALSRFEDPQTSEAMSLFEAGTGSMLIFVFAVVLFIPVCEELLFRGYFYEAWIGRWGFLRTSLVGSLIFTVLHVQYGWTGLVFIFIFSWVLFGIRWKTGSVLPAIVLHVINNSLVLVGTDKGVEALVRAIKG